MAKQVERIRDGKGYAYLVANVERFGNEVVRVMQGSKTVYNGAAADFVEKYSNKYAWTLCADVRINERDGLVDIVF
ncbi:MAG: hypothetical protein IKF14_05250 [Atopobiaceae bacterium]|nr:hypothetical protein [Atopobiaceae bacterium]MBR3158496.1 hypothetical protein [Atopobiaceae bacterium]